MTIYICDDSKSDLLRLNHHLQEYLSHQDQKITIESFQSGEELLRRYEETMEKPWRSHHLSFWISIWMIRMV